jgi:hypothetical protein
MKLSYEVKRKAALLAAALAGSILATAAVAAGSTLKSGDMSQVGQWYGRAGGLVGSDRVANLGGNASAPKVTVAYDKDVAARTNMPSDRTEGAGIAITYDKDVAKRTNMSQVEPTTTKN